MTHWIKGAVRRVMDRLAPSSSANKRGRAPWRKMRGVSTVEYALILVAVVAAVAAAGVAMQGSFRDLFTSLGTQMSETEGTLDESTAPSGPTGPTGPTSP